MNGQFHFDPTSSRPAESDKANHTVETVFFDCHHKPATNENRIPAKLLDHPRYRVLSFLGAGGMGMVFKAQHRFMERCVALKVIHPALVNHPGMVERFHREVRAAASLHHPNIAQAYDAEQFDDVHFLVLELVEGEDLEKLAERIGVMSVGAATESMRQATLGLNHAFSRGMVHRDIKPHNLMLDTLGQIKILDFGLARFVSESVSWPAGESSGQAVFNPWSRLTQVPLAVGTDVGWVLGTPDYLAPEEAIDARRADIRADIYSLGCTLYRLLGGQVPFPTRSAEEKVKSHLHADPIPLSHLRKDLPNELTLLVQHMMAKDPEARLQTPDEVAAALSPFADATELSNIKVSSTSC
jgi:serine/threonine protein kinase